MTDRHGKERNHIHARSLTLLIALVLLVAVRVGATVGFLHMKTDSIQNDFTYGKVSCEVLESFEEEDGFYGKRDVSIKNTGNTDAYIRVLLVFTWKDQDGNVFANRPEADKDYQINLALSNGWIVSHNDIGTYIYYKYPVAPGEKTPILIDGVRQAAGVTGPENGKYALPVEIIADAVQAEPAEAVTDAWDEATVGADRALSIQGGVSYGDPADSEGE